MEWLTAIPWPASTTANQNSTSLEALRDRAFLTKARQQLDADHFGLEKIKKRLIEYLAVVRLKELQAEKKAQLQANRVDQTEHLTGEVKRLSSSSPDKNDSKALIPYSPGSPAAVPADVQQQHTRQRQNVKGPILL